VIPGGSETVFAEIQEIPSKTYALDSENKRIAGYIDGLEAVKQAAAIILDINRFEHEILSWNFGNETRKLIGQPMDFAIIEAERYIREALIQDDRITDVIDFEFTPGKGKLYTQYRIVSVFGDFTQETEVIV